MAQVKDNKDNSNEVVRRSVAEKKKLTLPSTETKTVDSEDNEERGNWDNQLQFLLTTIGLAVGLGNIWRFPAMAYENGGSSFLFVYICCALLFAFPLVYVEFILGQYSRVGPNMVFYNFAPAFQGLGWTSGLQSATVAIYYTTIIAWSGIYMVFILVGDMSSWIKCGNWWNSIYCIDPELNDLCKSPMRPYYFNGTCHANQHPFMMSASEEYFINYILRKTNGISDMGSINYPMLASMISMWIIVALILIKGVDYMGKTAYVTTILPYVIVVVLFFRGVSLDGADIGLNYYLALPDWSYVFTFKTWTNALKQLMFSLSLGYGGLITLSSYSKFENNVYRDALILISCDTAMSLVGGCAVFSTLGYLSKKLNKPLSEVVTSGTSLAFIVYPEALASMPFPEVWCMLFFIMLFCLGISSEVAYVEILCTCIYDQYPKIRKKKWIVVFSFCTLYFCCGLLMCTGAGWYWFNIYDGYTGSSSACVIAFLESVIVAWVYGTKNLWKDVEEMRGEASKKWYWRIFGRQSVVIENCLRFVCPVLSAIVLIGTCLRERMVDKYRGQVYIYPVWTEMIGWSLNLLPVLAVPGYVVFNFCRMKKKGMKFANLFNLQPTIPSYKRIITEGNDAKKDKMLPEDNSDSKRNQNVSAKSHR